MQSTNTTYNNLLAADNHTFEVKLNINGTDYGQSVIYSARSDSKLFESAPTIGGTYSGTLEFSLLGDGSSIPKMAAVKPYFRVKAGNSTSSWYQKGLFFIDTRSVTHNDNGLTVFTAHCFDAMLKANAPYANSSLNWPATDTAVVSEIATAIGVTVDSRNSSVMTAGYSIPLPTAYTMRDILSFIGAMYAANWIITDEGKLRIVPISGGSDTLAVGKSCANLNLSPTRPAYTKVVFEVDESTAITKGSTETNVMEAYCPIGTQAACNSAYTTLSAWQYKPFDASGVWSNPAVEVGDGITVVGESGVIYSRTINFGPGMVMDLSATNDNYIDHEYAYESPEERRYTRTIDGMSSSISQNANNITLAVSNTPIVNLLPSVYRREAQNGASWTYNGITWVVNPDGSITASGTATANSDYNLTYNDASAPVAWIPLDTTKKHTMSGVPDVEGCAFRIAMYNASGTGIGTFQIDTSSGQGTSKTIGASTSYKYAYAYLRIYNGTAIPNGVTFYPMFEAGDTAHQYASTHGGSYAMESQIKQNASDITLKVSTTDYNGQTIIGKINLDASSATITASHINLQGAVSIESLDSSLQSSVNGVPVVNLLPSVYFREYKSGTWTNNGITWTVNADGSITATGTATANSDYFLTQTNDTEIPRLIVDPTKKYTISGVPNVSGTQMRVAAYNSSGVQVEGYVCGYGTTFGVKRTIPAGYYKYAPFLRVTSGTALPEGGATWFPMLEIGDTAHTYVSTHNGSGAIMAAAVASTVSCYYRSTTSTTPTISTSTTIGTAADTSNAWEYVMPQPKSGCYFFTCERYTYADGSVAFSTVRQIANATYTSLWCSSADSTYIDGGHIYTGSLTADKIAANETFTQKLYAQDFNITGGSVSITTANDTTDAIKLIHNNKFSYMSPTLVSVDNTTDGDDYTLIRSDVVATMKMSGGVGYPQAQITSTGNLSLGNASTNTKGAISVSDGTNTIIKIGAPNSNIEVGSGAKTKLYYDELRFTDSSNVTRADLLTSGLTFNDSNGNVTASYPADGLYLKDTRGSEYHYLQAGTTTYTMTAGAYLITTLGYNKTHIECTTMYLLSIYKGTGGANLAKVYAGGNIISMSVNDKTLTVTTTNNNVMLTIIKLTPDF